MPKFNDIVNNELKKRGLSVVDDPDPGKYQTRPKGYWFYGFCVPTGSYEDTVDKWPNYFATPPRVGDYVTSESGRRLQVLSITHMYEGGQPIIKIEIGKQKSSDVTPASGGSSKDVIFG